MSTPATPVKLPFTEWSKLIIGLSVHLVVIVAMFVRTQETVKHNTVLIDRQDELIGEIRKRSDENDREHAQILLRVVQQLGSLEGKVERRP